MRPPPGPGLEQLVDEHERGGLADVVVSATAKTANRSAEPSARGGVHTAMTTTSAARIAAELSVEVE